MYTTPDEQQAVQDTAQLIASPDNTHNSAKTKTRATPRKIPGLSRSPDRGYRSNDRELFGGQKRRGSLYASLMLGQLRHNFKTDEQTGKPKLAQRQHEGYFWAACSLTYWEKQLGLTRNEVRSGIECMKAFPKLVVIRSFRFGNTDVDHFRLTDEVLNPATVCEPHSLCGNHTALCASHTATSLKCDFEVEVEVYKQALPAADAAGPYPESQQASSENQTPNPTPDAVTDSPKISGKKKTGPKPKWETVTSNGDWVHYHRMAKKHDMDELLRLCKQAGLVEGYRTMLSDPECSLLERLEHYLPEAHFDDGTLEEHLAFVAGGEGSGEHYEHEHWANLCAVMESIALKDLHCPSKPDLKFWVKHARNYLFNWEQAAHDAKHGTYGPQMPKVVTMEPAPCMDASTTDEPAAEQVAPAQVVHYLPAEEYEDCSEPPEYVKPDQFDQAKAERARLMAAASKPKTKQPPPKPNMRQKGVKAA